MILRRDEPSLMLGPGNPISIGNLPSGEIRRTDIPYFTLSDEIIECR